MSAADPLTDIHNRLGAAGVSRALMVETWDGANRSMLVRIAGATGSRHAVALCWRGAGDFNDRALAARARTSALQEGGTLLDSLESSGQWLLVHGDAPIQQWARDLARIADLRPKLRIYVPHLAWPRFDSLPNPGWSDSVRELAHRQNIWLGVSAIAHFSVEPYPHEDIHKLAEAAAVCFRPERVLVGSDYPMFDKERYADYMRLAANWLTDLWPEWSVDNALFT
jgi:predicted TIM-barrel fold metal-dependent hydrolase